MLQQRLDSGQGLMDCSMQSNWHWWNPGGRMCWVSCSPFNHTARLA